MDPVLTQKKLLRVEEAAGLLGTSRTRVFDLIKRRRLRSVKIGNSRLVPMIALDEYVTLLLEESALDSTE